MDFLRFIWKGKFDEKGKIKNNSDISMYLYIFNPNSNCYIELHGYNNR